MTAALWLLIGLPFAAAVIAALLPGHRLPALGTVLVSLVTVLAALWLAMQPAESGNYFLADPVNAFFLVLGTLVSTTTALYSFSYIDHEARTGRLGGPALRVYHPAFLAMTGAMNLALTTNNIGLMWVGLELATLLTIAMVGLYRTPAAIEAAWKYFIIGSVGVSLAFFGTILIYLAGQGALGEGLPAMTWTLLRANAPQLDTALLNLAFIFLLVGYGTKTGLVPLHAWLPDAHAEGPTPVSAVLSGLLLNVALYALLRFKTVVAAHPGGIAPGPIMIAAGVISVGFAAFMLFQRQDIKRLFAYSSIEHMGLIVFAFGLGGAAASFAGLLHVAMHSLAKSAIFFAVGRICQAYGSQRLPDLRGLSASHPALGFGLAAGVVAIIGLPPSGVFLSEFLIVTDAFKTAPWLALLPLAGLLVAFAALLLKLQEVVFGEPSTPMHKVSAAGVPLAIHLLLVAAAGIYMPPAVAEALRAAAEVLK